MTTEIQPTRIEQYIGERLSWAHGHQGKPIAAFVVAILEKQTGSQAELAREFMGVGRRSSRARRAWRLSGSSIPWRPAPSALPSARSVRTWTTCC